MADIEKSENSGNTGKQVAAWIFMGLSLLYDISPVDLIPDIPVVGWIDDFFITATATLNVIQQTCTDSMIWLGKIAKTLKWILIVLGVLVVGIIALIVYLIVR